MQVQLEKLNDLERRMNIALPLETIDALVVERLKRTARHAKVQGFRLGKAPLKIVEMHYGAQIREEVLGEQVPKGFYHAITEQKLRVVGYPRFEPVDPLDSQNFWFCAVFEVYPEVIIGDLAEQEIEQPITAVTAEEIAKTIEILRKQRAHFVDTQRAAHSDDRVTVDFIGTIDGERFDGGAAENFVFVLGQKQMLAQFEASVTGLKTGESREFEVDFPEDYHGKEVAGKKAVFQITVKKVEEVQLPPLDANFAKALGLASGDVEKMHQEIEKNVKNEVKRRLFSLTKDHVMSALLRASNIEVPKVLVQLEMDRLAEQAQRDWQQRGSNTHPMPSLPLEVLRQQAQRRVALSLIFAELAQTNKLQATTEQVRNKVEELAQNYEISQEAVQWYYAAPERLEQVAALVLEEKIVEFVLSQAKVVEKNMPFDTLMGHNT